MKKLHKVLFGSALLTLAGTACAEIAEDTTYGYKYTNTADIYSPGGAGTVGNQRYDMYIQNLALGKPASASSRYNPGMFGPEQAVDGIYDSAYSGVQNFFHAADENKAWWKINYAETAAGIDSVVIFDRAGYTYRLDDYQITVWDGDPDGGGNLVWSSDIFDTSNTPRKEYAVPENVAGTWLKITNQVPEENASTNALTLSEVMIIGGKESKTGVYGNLDGGWIAPTFTSAADSTLQIDMNFSAADPVYDVLDVAGQFTAGGTLALNLLDSANIANGVDYQIIKAGSYAGSFTKVNISALDSANVVVLMNKLNSEGKISFETGRIHWKETAADTNFANNANWSSAPANQSVLYGVYTGSPSTSRLASEMALDQLHMGYSAGASGTLEIGAGGKLTVASQLNIGVGGAGVLTVNGGELDFTRNGADVEGFLVGQNSGSNGTLNVIDGTVNTYGFTVGTNSGAAGTVNVSGGSLNIRSGNNLRVGIHGVGTINVTGGTVTADCEVYMADQPSGSGTLSISGGMMTVNNGLSVGTRNAAVLNISAAHWP